MMASRWARVVSCAATVPAMNGMAPNAKLLRSKSHVPPPGARASPTKLLGDGTRSCAGRNQGRASETAVLGGPDLCLSLCECRGATASALKG